MTKKIVTRLTLGLALLAAPSVFLLGCGDEGTKPADTTPAPAPGGDAGKAAPGGGDMPKPAPAK
jgi:hypothetical protein